MIVELFSGIRGWGEGMRRIRPDLVDDVVGFEWNVDACRTAAAAGHHTVRADVAGWPLGHLLPVAGFIASPPCQTFSAAGNGEGRDDLDRLIHHAHIGELLETPDPRTGLVLEPLRWIHVLRPRWIAMEQVPAVAPVWHAYEHHLHTLGYGTWSGICNSADFGVPQTRRRAILLASLDRRPGRPTATHERNPGMFGLLPWVSMAEAVLLRYQERWVVTGGVTTDRYEPRPVSEPAPPITGAANTYVGDAQAFMAGDVSRARKLEVCEALVLQGFAHDYPVHGSLSSRHQQAGNAIPPGLAAAVLAQVVR